jgi:hypothetical protein
MNAKSRNSPGSSTVEQSSSASRIAGAIQFRTTIITIESAVARSVSVTRRVLPIRRNEAAFHKRQNRTDDANGHPWKFQNGRRDLRRVRQERRQNRDADPAQKSSLRIVIGQNGNV